MFAILRANSRELRAVAVNAVGTAPNLQHRIIWMDVSGPAAAARVEFLDWAGFRFTDFFVLFKGDDDKWKISGKVYDSHSKTDK